MTNFLYFTVEGNALQEANWKRILMLCMINFVNARLINVSEYSKLRGGIKLDDFSPEVFEGNDGEERLSEINWSSYNFREPNGPGTYAFGYDNSADQSGNDQYRTEEKLANGTVVGEYGYTDTRNNRLIRVVYTADHRGYRANTRISSLPGKGHFLDNIKRRYEP